MAMTFDEVIEQIIKISDWYRYEEEHRQIHQESETGGTVILKSSKYDVIIDIGDNQEYYYLRTYKVRDFGGVEDEPKNIKEVKSLKAVETYIRNFGDN